MNGELFIPHPAFWDFTPPLLPYHLLHRTVCEIMSKFAPGQERACSLVALARQASRASFHSYRQAEADFY